MFSFALSGLLFLRIKEHSFLLFYERNVAFTANVFVHGISRRTWKKD
ncbi:hypothetical protein NBRC111894_231 [Sporolactobacillus inulinus]|uniref:Uncharacterized protein n=1 Tax=Sporolactobacillus inulinus TaxID=2078 RepID=A0A4Y1Z6L3_9BACL|nr:hypothetical protein NBRC111894_231 [Sporolactobacillus inulinus]